MGVEKAADKGQSRLEEIIETSRTFDSFPAAFLLILHRAPADWRRPPRSGFPLEVLELKEGEETNRRR